jgi:vitamin B12 transporter
MLAFASGPAHAGSRPFARFDSSLAAARGARRYYDDRNLGRLGAYALCSRNRNRFAPAWRANAGLASSFRQPTFNALHALSGGRPYGIADNRPETGRNAELGLYYDGGMSQFSDALYHSPISNLPVNVSPCPIHPGVYANGCANDVNGALPRGLTVGAGTRLGRLQARASLDLQDPHDQSNDRLLQRRAPGDGLVNLHASLALDRGWSVFGRIGNLFDKDYELAKNYTEGRTVFVGVRYGFH